MKKTRDSVFSLRIFVPEHKYPLMSTGNRLCEFLIDDACALRCYGMLWKSDLFSLEEFLQRFFIELGADHADFAGDICCTPADLCLFGNIIEMDPCSVI